MLAAVLFGCAVAQTPVTKEVEFQGEGIRLAGVIQSPPGDSPKPAVLLLPGSGPTDRDGNQPPSVMTNLLKDLADSLTKAGYVTFRFDKRPVHRYASVWPKDLSAMSKFFSMENHVADVLAACKFLGDQPGVNKSKLAIIGHSEGAMLGLTAAAKLQPAAFVSLAGIGRGMDDVLKEQIGRNLANPQVPAEMRTSLTADLNRILAELKADAKLPSSIPPAYATLFNPTTVDIFHGYLTYDPISLAGAYKGPALVVNGEQDNQVNPERDAKPLFTAFTKRSNGVQQLLLIPKASHNFKDASDGGPGISGPVILQLKEGVLTFLDKQLH